MAQMKVKLIANDGTIVEVDLDVASKSNMLKGLHGDVTLSEINGRTLEKVMAYCTKYKNEVYVPKGDKDDQRIELTQEHIDFLDVDDEFLVEIVQGANYLDVPGLIDIICQKMANMIQGKTEAEIREIYGYKEDLTDEEKSKVKKEYERLDR